MISSCATLAKHLLEKYKLQSVPSHSSREQDGKGVIGSVCSLSQPPQLPNLEIDCDPLGDVGKK